MAGAIFGDVGGTPLLLRALQKNVSYVADVTHESHFAWRSSTVHFVVLCSTE